MEDKLYLLRFENEADGETTQYFLHDGYVDGSFYGAKTEELAREISRKSLLVSIPVGGFTVIGVTVEELGKMVGVPFKIIDFTGGFGGKGWHGVPILKSLEEVQL